MKGTAAKGGPDRTAERERDARTVAAALGGDLAAFDRLIEAYQRRAVAVAYRLIGNVEDAMDVCQEAFVRAYRSLATLQEPERFGTWLLRIVSNLSLNFRRDRRPMYSLNTDDDGGPMEDRTSSRRSGLVAAGNEPSALTAEVEQTVSAAIEELPEKQRMALILFAIEGMPQKDVAEILECSVEAVKWHVFQARKTLKDKLSDYLES